MLRIDHALSRHLYRRQRAGRQLRLTAIQLSGVDLRHVKHAVVVRLLHDRGQRGQLLLVPATTSAPVGSSGRFIRSRMAINSR